MIDTDPHKQTNPEVFGPTTEDTMLYRELLAKLKNGENLGFDPMFVAEGVAKRLDDAAQGIPGTLNLPISPEEAAKRSLDEEDALQLAQQRYVAAALGFKVGPNQFSDDAVKANVEYPNVATLPERPQRSKDGTFLRSDGTKMSQVQVDAIYAAHFVANHPEKFKQPGAFQGIFERVRKGAIKGNVTINLDTFSDDPRGAKSFIRQTARLMGYNVGEFRKADGGIAEMMVTGTREGFDSSKASFFDTQEKVADNADQESPEELDRPRLNELIEESRRPGVYFGKGLELTDHDRHQFDLIATRVHAYLEPFYEQPDWKKFMALVREEDKKGALISFADHKNTNVPAWCVDGGENAVIEKILRQSEHGTANAIQVPSKLFKVYHWKNTVDKLEGNYRDKSNETIKGQSPRQLGNILKNLAVLVDQIESNQAI